MTMEVRSRARAASAYLLVASLGLALLVGAARAAEEGFTLNLKDADLRSLVETVSQRTDRNFIVDPRVNAKVTVVSSSPVSDQALYQIFLSVLSVHGYSAVPSGDVTKIVPSQAAKQDAIPTEGDGSGSQLVTRVVPIEHVNAAQLVPILRPLLPQEGHLAAYQPTNRLIVTDSASNISRLMQIVERVDQPIQSGVEMVQLEHASASEIVQTVTSLQGPAQQEGGQGGPQLAADSRTNSVLISGQEETRLRLRSLIANLDIPLEREGNTRVIYLKYASAEDIVSTLESVSKARSSSEGGQNGGGTGGGNDPTSEVSIQSDANTNALILTGPPDRLDSLESIVRKLDIRRSQVLVEAIIAEVSQDKVRELGVQFGAVDQSSTDQPAALTNFSSGGNNIVQLAQEGALPGSGLTLGALSQSGATDFGVLVRALSSDANNNVLSTPSLVTLDNKEASITVGQNVPFVTGQFSSQQTGGDAQNPFQTIERRDVGITLTVKPQINEGDTIKLDIDQEVSSLSSSAQATADVVTDKRELSTTVLMQDNQTLVLGGLIDDSVRTTEERVPLLGDIPVLGSLFRFRDTEKTKQNLMVFLHPRILREQEVANHYTREKYDYLRDEQIARREDNKALLIDELPTLPELNLNHGAPSQAPRGSKDERDDRADGGADGDRR